MSRSITTLFATLVLVFNVSAQDVIGRVGQTDGAVELIRDGAVLHQTIQSGVPVHNYDWIRTQEGSRTELQISSNAALPATIIVTGDSEIVVAGFDAGNQTTVVIDFIDGSADVRTGDAVSIVRIGAEATAHAASGSDYSVRSTANGAVLILSQNGFVQVSDSHESVLFAVAGEAVEIDPEAQSFRNVRYDHDSASQFEQGWVDSQTRALLSDPEPTAIRLARLYGRRREDFEFAWANLTRYRDVTDRWIEESRRGLTTGDAAPTERETEFSEALANLSSIMLGFETLLSRATQMYQYESALLGSAGLQPMGDGGAEVATQQDFHEIIELDRPVMLHRFAIIRQLLGIYAERHRGALLQVNEVQLDAEN